MMQPRMQFVNLRLPDTWPPSADEFWRIVDQHQAPQRAYMRPQTISTLGSLLPQDYVEELLTDRSIVVQMAILSLSFFQQCAVDEIRDLRWDPSTCIQCPEVHRFVEALARTLLFYEDSALHPDTLFLNLEQELRHCLERLDWAMKRYCIQYDLDRLPYRPVRPADTEQAYAVQSQVLQVMDRSQYMQAWEYDPNAARKHLVSKLREIFHAHMMWPKQYAKSQGICVDTWIAELLQKFGIEDGTIAAIVTRFRVRAAREPQRRAKLLELRARVEEKALQRNRRRKPL